MKNTEAKKEAERLRAQVTDLQLEVAELKKTVAAQQQALATAEAKAWEERERLFNDLSRVTAIIETTTDFVGLASMSGEILYLNPAGQKLLQLTPEDCKNLRVNELIVVGQSPQFEDISAILADRGTWSGERYLRRKDGSMFPVWQVVTLVRDQAGVPIGRGAICYDLTRRKLAEDERERLITQLLGVTAIVETTTDFVSLANLSGEIQYINPAGLRLLGRSGEDPKSLRVNDLIVPDLSLTFEAILTEIKERERWIGERHLRHKDGSAIPVTQVVALLRNQAGEPIGLGSIAHDITERKRTLGELQQAKEGAEAASRAKGAFLAKMSHELRTPLNVILGFTQLLRRDASLAPEHREYLGIILHSGEHLLTLINDTLEMSKIEAGQISLRLQDCDLYDLLDGVEAMLRLRAEDKGLRLHFTRSDDTPQFIQTDKGKLRQVLLNLLGNAIKFTQRGVVGLLVQPEVAAEGPARLRFTVEDTGPGIAEEDLPTLFDAFVQAEAGRRSQEGTGLGLPICQQFVRLLGGSITVETELGRGSRFSFDALMVAAAPTAASRSLPARWVKSLAPGQPEYRILVVEDRWQNRALLTKLLSSVGFSVYEATNGQEAIAAWERFSPHLIWMDMAMPVMDGFQATRQIKRTKRGCQTVIIALTASAFDEDREVVLAEGCDDFVRKPFQEDIIFEKMARYLGVRYLHEEGEGPRPVAEGALPPLSPADFAALPKEWLDALRLAAVQLDQERMQELIEQIQDRAPQLAQALSTLSAGYAYDKILAAAGPLSLQ